MLVPSPFDVGAASGQVLLADVDRDGSLDLLTRHQRARSIKVHLGDGRARFETTGRAIALRFAPTDMELGDVNGDRILDLVVTATAHDVVDVLLGARGGAFTRARGAPFSVSDRTYRYNKRGLHLVDVNRDGDLDIVTENQRGQFAFRVMLGNGHGRFAPGPVLKMRPVEEGYGLAFGDVDRDGNVDAMSAVSHPRTGRMDVHLGDGRGRFGRIATSSVSLPPTHQIEAVADLNADRLPDLLISHRRAQVSILLNRGGGRFVPAPGSPFGLSARPFSLAPAHLDGDEELDIVAATVESVTVRGGDARQASFRAGPGAYDIAVGDLNGDERPDVVASSFDSEAVTVLVGR